MVLPFPNVHSSYEVALWCGLKLWSLCLTYNYHRPGVSRWIFSPPFIPLHPSPPPTTCMHYLYYCIHTCLKKPQIQLGTLQYIVVWLYVAILICSYIAIWLLCTQYKCHAINLAKFLCSSKCTYVRIHGKFSRPSHILLLIVIYVATCIHTCVTNLLPYCIDTY